MYRYAFGFCLTSVCCATALQAAPYARLVVDAELSPPVRLAVEELSSALKHQGLEAIEVRQVDPEAEINFVMGQVGASPLVDQLIEQHHLAVPQPAESLLIKPLGEAQSTIVLSGRDAMGLAYAVLEAAEAVRLGPHGGKAWSVVREAVESPRLRVRSVSVHLFNADLERSWYFDDEYWHGYFAMLVKNRFNRFILTFADQTNYLTPPYPWLFDVPEYPEVLVEGLSKDDQLRNYQMLRRISEIAAEHGINFTLGIWTQQPMLKPGMGPGPTTDNFGPTPLRNLPAGERLIDYNTRALGTLLKECPAISGVQLRINDESGIPEDRQKNYYETLFATIKHCGHPVRLELRYKGLRQATIDEAVRAGLDVTVSTKFWCEHMGLPFHPTTQDPLYSANRYGYGTLLSYPRAYRVTYQLWNQGSSRLLLWGDPSYAARFAESCLLGDGEGFEIFAPLTNKGYGNQPGDWRIFADRTLEHYRWEYERYWNYFLVFGRMGYNPQTPGDVWQRELRNRFGAAAADVESAYRHASQVLPLLTAVCLYSASEWRFWPEMDTGGPIEAYGVIQPSDYGQFYGIQPWRPVPGWLAEPWSANHRGFVEDAIAGNVDAKWTPLQVSRELDRLAENARVAIESARGKVTDPSSAEFRSTELDMRVLAQLARYHAAKKRSATHLAFFRATAEMGRLSKALEDIRSAEAAWEQLVKWTDGAYQDRLIFGDSGITINANDRKVDNHAGHWKDRLPEVRADVKYVAELAASHGAANQTYRVFPGEFPLEQPPRIQHKCISRTQHGVDMAIVAQVESRVPVRKMLLHFRPLDQTKDWKTIVMQASGDGSYNATVPGEAVSTRYDILYYLEARVDGGGTFWPNWEEQTPYVLVSIDRVSQ